MARPVNVAVKTERADRFSLPRGEGVVARLHRTAPKEAISRATRFGQMNALFHDPPTPADFRNARRLSPCADPAKTEDLTLAYRVSRFWRYCHIAAAIVGTPGDVG